MRRTQRRHRLRLARRATVLQLHLLLARESTREDYPKLQFRSERVAIYLVRGVPEGVHSSAIAQQRAAIPQPRSRRADGALPHLESSQRLSIEGVERKRRRQPLPLLMVASPLRLNWGCGHLP